MDYNIATFVQVYETMNGILNEDSSCSQRELRLRTYQVIPMTPRCVYTGSLL